MDVGGSKVCVGGQTQSYDPNAHDIEAPATALTELTNLYKKTSQKAWSSFTQGTPVTGMEVGASYDFVYGINATDFIDNAYGPRVTISSLPCVADSDQALYQDEVATSLTATFYNNNHDASAESASAGVSETVYNKWCAGNNEVFGNPYLATDSMTQNIQDANHRKQYPNKWCIQVNTTTHDTPVKVRAKLSDGSVVEMNRLSIPVTLTATAGHTSYCYEAPIVTEDCIEILFTYDADDSSAPADDDTASLFAGSYYLDETGQVRWGVVTDQGGYVGASAADTLANDFT